jgi:hypothetical protein
MQPLKNIERETLCATCIHQNVCKFKPEITEEFWKEAEGSPVVIFPAVIGCAFHELEKKAEIAAPTPQTPIPKRKVQPPVSQPQESVLPNPATASNTIKNLSSLLKKKPANPNSLLATIHQALANQTVETDEKPVITQATKKLDPNLPPMPTKKPTKFGEAIARQLIQEEDTPLPPASEEISETEEVTQNIYPSKTQEDFEIVRDDNPPPSPIGKRKIKLNLQRN